MQVGWVKIGHFRRKTCYNWKTVQDRRIVFLLKSNRKSYALYQIVMFPMTLGDPKPPQFFFFRRLSYLRSTSYLLYRLIVASPSQWTINCV